MRTVDIQTVQGDHLVFYNVILAGPSERERFFCVKRPDKMDYIPVFDIKRVTVMDGVEPRKHSRSKQGRK